MTVGNGSGTPEPDGSGEQIDDQTGARMPLAGDFGKLAATVAEFETTARHLKAIRRRAGFRIIE